MFTKNRLIKGILAIAILAICLPNPKAFAQPVVTITNTGSGSSVSISVSGASYNQNVDLVYVLPNSSLQTVISNIGTAYGGAWTGNLNLNDYGILSGSQVFVRVGGQQSNTITIGSGYTGGCTYNCGSPYGLSLSQNSVNVSVGQSQTITANNYGSGIYISSNSNPNIASASVSGSQINIYGLASGTTNVSVCANSGSYVCATVYVTVSGSSICPYGGCGINIQFSPSSLTLDVGQTSRVSINPNRSYLVQNLYYVSSNSNPNVASVSIFGVGDSLTVNALSAGSTNIIVCENQSASNCGTLYISVRNTGTGSGNLWFSPSNPTMSVGQSLAVSVNSSVSSASYYSGSSNAYYISSNSSPNVATVSVSGTAINLYANQAGNSTITVCHISLSLCGSIYLTVSSAGGSNQLSFSEDSPNINLNQTRSITVYYNNVATSNFYISSNSSPSIVNATASGNTVNLYGQNIGSSTINICYSSTSACKSLFVTVGGYASGNLTFSQQNINLNYAQNINVNIYGGSGSGAYYISSNSNPAIATASISGSTVYLYGQSQGSATVVVCQNNTASCGTLYVTVYGSGGTGTGVWFSQTNSTVGVNQTSSVIVYSNLGSNYYISSNSNPSVVTPSVVGNTVNLYGRTVGSSNVVVCHSTASSLCGTLFVTVGGGGYGGGSLALSQTSLNLSVSQSATVSVYNQTGSIYISSNSNPSVAGASVSSTNINVYASSPGSTSVVVCQNNASGCATLSITVDGYAGGNLYLLTSSLPTVALNQFYNQQLQVSGGTPPYNFSLLSGALPAGFNLSNTGVLSGIASSAVNSNFTVRVSDNFGRTTTGGFSLTSGSVKGIINYKNGQLIKEGNTIYIVYRNLKTGFANLSAFNGFGFKLANVVSVSNTGLDASGFTLTTSHASHPWGSWIKSGNTVYFVHEIGLVPVPDMAVFTNNGGVEQYVVPANIKDFTLPILPTMVSDDNRLR